MSDRFDEMATKIYRTEFDGDSGIDIPAIADALRSTWNEAIEAAALVSERTASNPWYAIRDIKEPKR